MRYACAGHPPPVLMRAGPRRRASCGTGARSPLDADAPAGRRAPRRRVELAPGATVLLYTDGLVERRDRSLDEGMHALVGAVGELRDLEPAELTEALTDALGRRSGITDDVCVLALRRAGD